jgi:cytoplasmic tRNA 2-thiolation protein 2
VSGGASSSAMLQFIKDGLSLDNQHRRLQFIPSLLHIDESILLPKTADCVPHDGHLLESISKHGFDYYVTSIAKSFRQSDVPFFSKNENSGAHAEESENQKLVQALSSVTSATSKEELIRRLRIRLIVDVAVAGGFDAIFLGTSGSRLSIQLITDVAQGKGNQIDLETVCDFTFCNLYT